MTNFRAHISVPAARSSHVKEHFEYYAEHLDPLQALSLRPLVASGPSGHPLTYFEISGALKVGQTEQHFDSNPDSPVAVARILAGHLHLLTPNAAVHYVALGQDECNPFAIDSTEGSGPITGINGSGLHRLALVGLHDSSQPGLDGTEIVNLGYEDQETPRQPLYPLVTEWVHAGDSPFLTFLHHDALEAWAREAFEDWLIARL